MVPNLKVDIIYYKTSSDFELEFNLSGVCRMRIFKDKADSSKTLIKQLARDVSRSRIILIVTDLLSENNGVKVVADAIGLPLVAPDKAKYGIRSADTIVLPKGALPLVTKDGVYGGCIAESAPQAIIMVSDDRTLRHEIMKNLVHPYIFDISQIAAYNERIKQAGGSDFLPPLGPISEMKKLSDLTVPGEQDTPASETDEQEEVTPPSVPDEEKETTDEEDEALEETPLSSFLAPGTMLTSQLEDEEEEEPTETGTPIRRTKKGSNIALLIVSVLLLISFGILAYYFIYLPLVEGDTPAFISEISDLLAKLGVAS